MEDSSTFRRVGCMVVLFAVVNGVLWAGQEIANADEKKQMEALSAELSTMESSIKAIESTLTTKAGSLEGQQASLDSCSVKMDGFKRVAVGGALPELEYQKYLQVKGTCEPLVTRYNADYLAYESLFSEYSRNVDTFNSKIGQYNRLADETALWLLVPLPRSLRGKAVMAHVLTTANNISKLPANQ